MASNVRIDQLAAEITLVVQQYTEKVSEGVVAELDKTSKAVLADIKDASPVKTGDYKKGWARKKEGSGGRVKYTIHQKSKPRIAHLLEFGHAKVGGGRVAAIPHMRPAYDKHAKDMDKRIEQIIRNGG